MATPSLAPYASRHTNLNGPGDSRPSAADVIYDQDLAGKLHDKVVLITGATSGIGLQAAKALHITGAKIFITARSLAKGTEAAKQIANDGSVEVLVMELDSFESIRRAVNEFVSSSSKLNVLINNAGVMATPQSTTHDGFETQFGTNHLGHFLLFQLLKPLLLSSATPSFASRVISLSSAAHKMSGLKPENYSLSDPSDPYEPWKAYGQSKTANIYFVSELERRYASRGLHGLSVHPGSITTSLTRHLESEFLAKVFEDDAYRAQHKSPEQGAATEVWAAVAQELEGRGGWYLENVSVAKPLIKGEPTYSPGFAEHAYNPELEKRLWRDSLEMVGLQDDQ